MTEFTPIPGVWYREATDGGEGDPDAIIRYLYAPMHPQANCPWWNPLENQWVPREDVPENLVIDYSPHPPESTDPLWRSGTLRGVVEETAPIFAQVYARGGQGSSATDLLFDLVKIHEIITDHRISAGIARPESQEETITHATEWTEVTE